MSARRRLLTVLIGFGIVALLVVATRDVLTRGKTSHVATRRSAPTTTTTTAEVPVEAPPTSRAPITTTVTTTAAATTATTAVATTPPGDCQPGELALTTTTDRPTYSAGQAVGLVTSAKNISGRTCNFQDYVCDDTISVADAQGTTVWTSTAPGTARCGVVAGHLLKPGDAVNHPTSWDRRRCTPGACPGPQVGAGTYTAQGHWPQHGDATPASFRLS
jgi:hypothetical protein